MTTGYTADINGVTFEQFAMRCARAFGALVLMRDQPSDAPIPERFEPSDYHLKKIEESKAELKKLNQMSMAEANQEAARLWDAEESNRVKRLEECRSLRQQYEALLAEAKAWVPPTADHIKLKEFMTQQLENTINFDCSEDYYLNPIPLLSAEQWLDQKKAKAQHNIEYHTQEHVEEVERTNGRNSWLQSLRESLVKED